MSKKRIMIRDNGIQREAAPAEVSTISAPPGIARDATAGALSLTVPMISPGVSLVRTGGGGAGFADTLPLNAAMVAALPDIEVGESYVMTYVNRTGQICTLTASASFTVAAAGGTTIGVGVTAQIKITRNAAATWVAEII